MLRHGLLTLLAGALCASAALGATVYDWIAEGEDLCWTTQDNWDWDHSVNPYYPGTTDTARFGWPYAGGSWTVGLETGEIAWLEVVDNTTFEGCASSAILTTDVVSIIGPDTGSGYVTLEVTAGRIMTSQN